MNLNKTYQGPALSRNKVYIIGYSSCLVLQLFACFHSKYSKHGGFISSLNQKNQLMYNLVDTF